MKCYEKFPLGHHFQEYWHSELIVWNIFTSDRKKFKNVILFSDPLQLLRNGVLGSQQTWQRM